MELLVIFLIGWACRQAYLDVRNHLRSSRQSRIATVEKQIAPKTLTKTQRKVTAARHDTGWWWREALHGFPVARYGWKRGWTAHQVAHEEHRQAHGQQKARLAEIRKQGQANVQAVAGEPGSLTRDQMKQKMQQASPPAQTQGQQLSPATPVPAAAPAPQPPAAGATVTVPAAGPSPEKPAAAGETAAPSPAAAAPPDPKTPEPVPAPVPTPNGVPVPTGPQPEITYDQTIDTLNKHLAHYEAAQAEFERLGVSQFADQLSVAGMDRGNLANVTDMAAAHDRIVDGFKSLIDHTTATRDNIRRDHGPVADAHQAAPDGGAEKPYYAGV